MPPYEEP
uniref:Uncharacterized protein n=1 Tax=Haemonchus contortus TaxID=6289 RepID=A0A7I4Y1N0_HAECO